ncbi:hypothetical protein PYCCODRAFT_1434945 [Trametes coccinea BRFM310]|uniref:Glucose receptor Git3 N-terminal domain-containing protein n=1 Tax=Trametes coccinea (strain BRFM310) TaxID=1353009 RepID=A0A1Y2IPM9_TRAC3|nr:hypothetical protein PYCCODRAFT_1434945 [Trametes coccinea BRFM310]
MAYLDGGYNDTVATLLDGDSFIFKRPYTASEAGGVLLLAVVSCVSAIAVAGLLLAMAVSAYNTRNSPSPNLFVRSHVAAYFVSMLLCEVVQTIGSIMNIRWFNQMAVTYEPYCTVQGVLKHVSDVGTAYWSLIIAMNTFWILFLRWKLRRFVLIGALAAGWTAIGAIVSAGPAAIQKAERGPFYAISGYWCWIQDEYPSERITLDYMIMFISALLSFIMYTLVFFRLRGNVLLHGWRLSFRFRRGPTEPAAKSVDTHAMNVAKGMLLYPVAYTILLLPIAISRFSEWMGHEVPFTVTIVCDAVFLLSGFVNVILFLTTRRVLPANSVFPRSICRLFNSSRASTYTTSSTLTDIEKVVLEESMLTPTSSIDARTLSNGKAPQYPESPYYSPGKVAEGYDQISLDSAKAERVWRDSASLNTEPISDQRMSSPSPTITVPIPSSKFNPFEDRDHAKEQE